MLFESRTECNVVSVSYGTLFKDTKSTLNHSSCVFGTFEISDWSQPLLDA